MTDEPLYWKHRAQDAEAELIKARSVIRVWLMGTVFALIVIAIALIAPGRCG